MNKTNQKVLAILDGDEIAYTSAAITNQRFIRVKNKETGVSVEFKTKTEFNNFLKPKQTEMLDIYEIEEDQEGEPISHTINAMKRKIDGILEQVGTHQYEIYLSGHDNFRLDLPLPEQYKHRRLKLMRPPNLQQAKDYLIKYKGAKIVAGDEADQMVAQRMYEGYLNGEKLIGVTYDKDARSNIGWLYNPDTKELTFNENEFGWLKHEKDKGVKGFGRLFLYYQMLMGDWETDQYCPRQIVKAITGKSPTYGAKTCYEDLKDCTTDIDAINKVFQRYQQWFGEGDSTYTSWQGDTVTTNWRHALQLIIDCAYMRKSKIDRLTVEKLEKFLHKNNKSSQANDE